jgi:hypothetical protein
MNRKIIGVYATNDIPKKKYPLPYGLIVNTETHYIPGKHWVALYIDERGLLETLDSYGNPFIYTSLTKSRHSMHTTVKSFINKIIYKLIVHFKIPIEYINDVFHRI